MRGEWDLVILATKAHHTEDAVARSLLPHLSPSGCVISAQNGLNELAIADAAGRDRTVGAFVNFGADYLEPGVVHFGGRGAVVIGETDGRITPRAEAIHRAWLDFDSAAILSTNIWGYLWGKEAYGAMLFATALTNESIADALAAEEHRPLYIALAREILAVAAARGVVPERFDGFAPAAWLPGALPGARRTLARRSRRVFLNRRSAKTHSGIWRDLAVRKNVATEVDAQIGIVVALGGGAGVPGRPCARASSS